MYILKKIIFFVLFTITLSLVVDILVSAFQLNTIHIENSQVENAYNSNTFTESDTNLDEIKLDDNSIIIDFTTIRNLIYINNLETFDMPTKYVNNNNNKMFVFLRKLTVFFSTN